MNQGGGNYGNGYPPQGYQQQGHQQQQQGQQGYPQQQVSPQHPHAPGNLIPVQSQPYQPPAQPADLSHIPKVSQALLDRQRQSFRDNTNQDKSLFFKPRQPSGVGEQAAVLFAVRLLPTVEQQESGDHTLPYWRELRRHWLNVPHRDKGRIRAPRLCLGDDCMICKLRAFSKDNSLYFNDFNSQRRFYVNMIDLADKNGHFVPESGVCKSKVWNFGQRASAAIGDAVGSTGLIWTFEYNCIIEVKIFKTSSSATDTFYEARVLKQRPIEPELANIQLDPLIPENLEMMRSPEDQLKELLQCYEVQTKQFLAATGQTVNPVQPAVYQVPAQPQLQQPTQGYQQNSQSQYVPTQQTYAPPAPQGYQQPPQQAQPASQQMPTSPQYTGQPMPQSNVGGSQSVTQQSGGMPDDPTIDYSGGNSGSTGGNPPF